MVRYPRRTHSVSGPPSVHCLLRDVACCCNIIKINQFHASLMALRRNPQRKCKKEEAEPKPFDSIEGDIEQISEVKSPLKTWPQATHQHIRSDTSEPFAFLDLPREVRDHVYSYLVVRRGKRVPVIEGKSILRVQKKRITAQRTRERLNQKRALSGKRPIVPREPPTDPIIHSTVLQASRQVHHEATDLLYKSNWFGISLEMLDFNTLDVPTGWNLKRITKIQVELQLKDSQRMNSFNDWTAFFAFFPALRFLRIIPTFHSRYYDWTRTELGTWDNTHFVFRGFFRELVAAVPLQIHLMLGPSIDSKEDMHLEGRTHVSTRLLQQMYAEFGNLRGMDSR
ncbi:hypothetical protein EJ04DRAFT_70830 [Polyplosphaeria fusca]|uniref:Uncharacterized protein n=1 Tax=Polyplosphaeria fusca TaxID=682080 RepID=A0A9P4R7Y5_9PLEO|nr:hypothetical protein EJ04DRAFT_70830 [Polyplosphaeria fusca]